MRRQGEVIYEVAGIHGAMIRTRLWRIVIGVSGLGSLVRWFPEARLPSMAVGQDIKASQDHCAKESGQGYQRYQWNELERAAAGCGRDYVRNRWHPRHGFAGPKDGIGPGARPGRAVDAGP